MYPVSTWFLLQFLNDRFICYFLERDVVTLLYILIKDEKENEPIINVNEYTDLYLHVCNVISNH